MLADIIQTARALAEEGFPHPWKLAFDMCVKHRFLPHRTWLLIGRNGFVHDPPILQWNWGRRMLWQDDEEIRRQRKIALDRVHRAQ